MTKAEELAAKLCPIGHSALKTCGSCSRLVDHFEAAMAFERAQERKRWADRNSEYRRLLEKLLEFGENSGNWTGNLASSAWNMTPAEDRALDRLWDDVRELLSKSER